MPKKYSKETKAVAREFGWSVNEEDPHMDLCEEIATLRKQRLQLTTASQNFYQQYMVYTECAGPNEKPTKVNRAIRELLKVLKGLPKPN